MAIKLITPAATDPITLAEAKAHLRVDHTDDDAMIASLITAATRNAEAWTGRALIDQTWEITLDEFPADELELSRPPLIELLSVTYDDGDGIPQIMPAAGYVVDTVSEPGRVVAIGGFWPTPIDAINAVRVRFRAGYLNSGMSPAVANVPLDIKQAILLELGTYYLQRETILIGQTVVTLTAWESLLRPHRVERGMA